MTRVALVLGTRPEAIKLAPVARAFRAAPGCAAPIWSSGQHRELAREALGAFGLAPDVDLALMRPGQSLSELAGRLLVGLDALLAEHAPDAVVVQGDTTTALCGALAAFHRRVPVAHVEAGLRTHDLTSPFPEEANRQLISRLARWHFAATPRAADALRGEGVTQGVHVVGNPVIDALNWIPESGGPAEPSEPARPLVLWTAHRRENFGAPLREALGALRTLALEFPGARFVFPVHPNPEVRAAVAETWPAGAPANLELCGPLPYPEFARLMRSAAFLVSDSGGVQEEATALGKPVILLRDDTERPEAVEAGVVELVGPHAAGILSAARGLLGDPAELARRSAPSAAFGDGRSGERIAGICLADLGARP